MGGCCSTRVRCDVRDVGMVDKRCLWLYEAGGESGCMASRASQSVLRAAICSRWVSCGPCAANRYRQRTCHRRARFCCVKQCCSRTKLCCASRIPAAFQQSRAYCDSHGTLRHTSHSKARRSVDAASNATPDTRCHSHSAHSCRPQHTNCSVHTGSTPTRQLQSNPRSTVGRAVLESVATTSHC